MSSTDLDTKLTIHTPYKDVLEIIPETTQPTSDGLHPLFKSISDYVKRANLL